MIENLNFTLKARQENLEFQFLDELSMGLDVCCYCYSLM